MERELGEKGHCRHQVSGLIPAEIETLHVFLGLPAPLLLEGLPFVRREFDFTHKKLLYKAPLTIKTVAPLATDCRMAHCSRRRRTVP